ncbi:MAG TPA: T9SS type A sorting domain-containing protein, partial [Bacteroidia bacterium]|nr:T9SS type A sorting domain-containing protein [Bacteroidia bacterium]
PGSNTVWVKVTDANNCVAVDSINIGYYNPKVVIIGDTAQCINQKITLTAQLSDTTATPVFGWSGFSINTAAINPVLTANTQYDFTLTDGSGCIVNASHTVTAYDPQVSPGHPSAVCAGDSILFTASTGGGLAPHTVSWAPFRLNGSSVKIGTSAAGIVNYTATVTDAFGCVKDQAGFVTVNALPTVNTVSPGVVCQSVNTLDLSVYSTPVGGIWSGTGVSGDSLNTSLSDTGLINLDYVYTNNSTGCKSSSSTWVYIELQPVASFTADSVTGPVTHNFNFSNSSVKASYNSVTWDFGDPASGPANYATTLNANHTFSDSGTYTVKLVLSAGACDPDTEVMVITVYRVSGPNSIHNAGVINARVYPNPATDIITVEGDDIESIRIVDVQGREMNIEVLQVSGNQCIVNVKSLSSGLYFVEITDIYHRVSQVKIAVQR